MHRTTLPLLVLLGLGCAGLSQPPAVLLGLETDTPADTDEAPEQEARTARVARVQAVYDAYIADTPTEPGQLPFTRDLLQRWTTAEGVGFDPIIAGQDYQLGDVRLSLDGDDVVARFTNFGQAEQVRWVMVEQDGTWLADDLQHADWKLRETLGD